MNDPNGLVYYQGEYHLFYQHHPGSLYWGPMHWGHAVSTDLVRWTNLPIALYPDPELGMIFSGTVVVDKNSSSGLFGPGGGGLVALFTHAGNEQQQSLAYSVDRGRTWVKYQGNPVIPNTSLDSIPKDFRDPNVRWIDHLGLWVMTLAVRDHVEFWTSTNLIHWKKNSEFGREQGAHGGVWECPSLVPMKVEGSDNYRWVLFSSINPGGPNGGSATQYFVGNLETQDGVVQFTTRQTKTLWLDGGKDNYAGIPFGNVDRRVYFLGWMSNWQYADRVPTSPWRGAATVSRELTLRQDGNDLVVFSFPVSNYQTLLAPSILEVESPTPGNSYSVGPSLSSSWIHIEWSGPGEHDVELVLSGTGQESQSVGIGYTSATRQLFIDRSSLGGGQVPSSLGGVQWISAESLCFPLTLDLLVDQCSIEAFFNGGRYVVTDLVFPDGQFSQVQSISEGGKNLSVRPVGSIWHIR